MAKKLWIKKALSGGKNKGALKRTALRKGLIHSMDEPLSKTDLHKLEKVGGTTAKRAYLAETLSKFKDGGNVNATMPESDIKQFNKFYGTKLKKGATQLDAAKASLPVLEKQLVSLKKKPKSDENDMEIFTKMMIDGSKKIISQSKSKKMESGGSINKFLSKAKTLAKKGFEKTKSATKEGYEKNKKYAKDKIHDQKKKIAIEVLDSTKDKVGDNKKKMTIKAAESIVKDKFEHGGEIKKDWLSIKQIEEKLSRKLHWWNDDMVSIDNVAYEKCFMLPYYKKVEIEEVKETPSQSSSSDLGTTTV